MFYILENYYDLFKQEDILLDELYNLREDKIEDYLTKINRNQARNLIDALKKDKSKISYIRSVILKVEKKNRAMIYICLEYPIAKCIKIDSNDIKKLKLGVSKKFFNLKTFYGYAVDNSPCFNIFKFAPDDLTKAPIKGSMRKIESLIGEEYRKAYVEYYNANKDLPGEEFYNNMNNNRDDMNRFLKAGENIMIAGAVAKKLEEIRRTIEKIEQ